MTWLWPGTLAASPCQTAWTSGHTWTIKRIFYAHGLAENNCIGNNAKFCSRAQSFFTLLVPQTKASSIPLQLNDCQHIIYITSRLGAQGRLERSHRAVFLNNLKLGLGVEKEIFLASIKCCSKVGHSVLFCWRTRPHDLQCAWHLFLKNLRNVHEVQRFCWLLSCKSDIFGHTWRRVQQLSGECSKNAMSARLQTEIFRALM